MSGSTACARTLLAQLIAQGVREIVVCPGSRSAPLALAAFDADASGAARLHVRTDERTAGFLALGLAKASGVPAAVITTSGTAAGNLLPAVMEAAHAGVGLIVITADRPAAVVGFGANQTTEQVGLFGGFVRYAARVNSAASEATWQAQAAKAAVLAASGPVQLNVELDVPLVGGDAPSFSDALARVRPLVISDAHGAAEPVALANDRRTVIVAGDATPEVGAWAAQLAAASRTPLIAEPSSNARHGATALPLGRLLLASELADAVERVIVVGHPTLSRPVMRLLSRADVEVIAVGEGDWPDPGHRVRRVAASVALAKGDPDWLARWLDAHRAASDRLAGALEGAALTGWTLAQAVWASAADGNLVLGASQLIRDADLVGRAAAHPTVFANRGLAGIDGTVSTAVGVALASGRPTTLLCGDLTFVHDANALALGPSEARPPLRIVVGDDRGGAIFATLEYGAAEFEAPFERVFGTAPGVDVAALAASYGVPVERVTSDADLAAALGRPIAGIDVVVVALDRTRRRALNLRLSAPPTA